jgi:hypothetical protein
MHMPATLVHTQRASNVTSPRNKCQLLAALAACVNYYFEPLSPCRAAAAAAWRKKGTPAVNLPARKEQGGFGPSPFSSLFSRKRATQRRGGRVISTSSRWRKNRQAAVILYFMNASLRERMLVLESVCVCECAALDFRVERRIEFKTHLTPPWHFSYVPQIYGGTDSFLRRVRFFS